MKISLMMLMPNRMNKNRKFIKRGITTLPEIWQKVIDENEQ